MVVWFTWFRRLLLIRLATLFIACTVTAGLLAWVAAERRESRRQLEVARRVQAVLEADRGQMSSIGLTYGGPFDQPDVREQSWWRRVARAVLGTRVVKFNLYSDDPGVFAEIGEFRDLVHSEIQGGQHLTTDLTPIGRLLKLRSLNVRGSIQADNLSPLASLNRLEVLSLRFDKSIDLGPLGQLKQLERLYLDFRAGESVGRVDIAPLAGLRRLKELEVYGPVIDLSPLAELEQLVLLKLSHIQDNDLMPLAELRRLVDLDIFICGVSNLRPIAGLKELKRLGIFDTKVVDLTPIGGLANLRELDISNTAVSDLSPILRLSKLRELDAADSTHIDTAEWDRYFRARPKCTVRKHLWQ